MKGIRLFHGENALAHISNSLTYLNEQQTKPNLSLKGTTRAIPPSILEYDQNRLAIVRGFMNKL